MNLVLGTVKKECGCIEREELVPPNESMPQPLKVTISVSDCAMHRHRKQSYEERSPL